MVKRAIGRTRITISQVSGSIPSGTGPGCWLKTGGTRNNAMSKIDMRADNSIAMAGNVTLTGVPERAGPAA